MSGGLPRRGVKDISLLQHFQIEALEAISKKQELGGFTLDLVKAFNKIPVAPLKSLFEKFGIPGPGIVSTASQTGVWPAALHSADTQMVGDKHWRNLRRASTRALIGSHRNSSSYLACAALSTKIQDPLLYNICQMLRTMRRCAFLFPELAEKIAKFAYHFDEKIVYGPGGAMKKYLAKIG